MSIDKVNLRCLNPVAPVVFGNELSYLECLGKVAEKVNELVSVINDVNVETIRNELSELRNYVNTSVSNLQNTVNNELEKQTVYVIGLLDSTIESIDNTLNSVMNDISLQLQEALQEILSYLDLLSINATGKSELSGNQVLIDRAFDIVYDRSRYYGLTCSEYENLSITATNYQSLNISANGYDIYGKVRLTPVYNGSITYALSTGTTYTNTFNIEYLVYKSKFSCMAKTPNSFTPSSVYPQYVPFGYIRSNFGLPANNEFVKCGYVEIVNNTQEIVPIPIYYIVTTTQPDRLTFYIDQNLSQNYTGVIVKVNCEMKLPDIERS